MHPSPLAGKLTVLPSSSLLPSPLVSSFSPPLIILNHIRGVPPKNKEMEIIMRRKYILYIRGPLESLTATEKKWPNRHKKASLVKWALIALMQLVYCHCPLFCRRRRRLNCMGPFFASPPSMEYNHADDDTKPSRIGYVEIERKGRRGREAFSQQKLAKKSLLIIGSGAKPTDKGRERTEI